MMKSSGSSTTKLVNKMAKRFCPDLGEMVWANWARKANNGLGAFRCTKCDRLH